MEGVSEGAVRCADAHMAGRGNLDCTSVVGLVQSPLMQPPHLPSQVCGRRFPCNIIWLYCRA